MKEIEVISEIRKFNRSYVRSIGLLQKTFLDTNYSLTESQVIFLVKEQGKTTATAINKVLQLDEGYLSRIIKKLISDSLLIKEQSQADKRCFEIMLSPKGIEEQRKMDKLSSESVRAIISHLSETEQQELAGSFQRIMALLYKENGHKTS
ncbi:MarR family winged helix-turn-helix transcriptional regulator [Sinomicrobium oceani]|uniref:MarR family winged helix-turn-helix transcriptional regulator n=1 Tax=Sinomicrobium oceani TaxID=1150368 RepID=UPI00227D4CD1|nr:MarR family winged helix-turn-helix transcriptional regulator [Sinomicrobium oceani]